MALVAHSQNKHILWSDASLVKKDHTSSAAWPFRFPAGPTQLTAPGVRFRLWGPARGVCA